MRLTSFSTQSDPEMKTRTIAIMVGKDSIKDWKKSKPGVRESDVGSKKRKRQAMHAS